MQKIAFFIIFVLLIHVVSRKRHREIEIDSEMNIDGDELKDQTNKLSQYMLQPTLNSAENNYILNKDITSITWLENHHLYRDQYNDNSRGGETLIYVTPWNKKGFYFSQLMAKQSKLTWLVPVWFQIRKHDNGHLYIAGEHDIDIEWMRSFTILKEESTCPKSYLKIIPRVVLECEINSIKEIEEVSEMLLELLSKYEKMNFVGFTFEISFQHIDVAVKLPLLLKKKKKQIKLVFVLPPIQLAGHDTTLGKQEREVISQLAINFDRFSVMTYDKDRNGNPIAPLSWVKSCLEPLSHLKVLNDKLLLGIPFYGWNSRGEAMTADDMIKWITSDKSVTLKWDTIAKEHVWKDSNGMKSSYPTPWMLQERLKLSNELNLMGVAIWELGQGVAANMDIF
jgi:hypothetical protein